MTAAPFTGHDGSQRAQGHDPRPRITGERVRRWRFEPASMMRRGYDQADVDAFRIQVAVELDILAAQVADLRAENERLTERVEMHRHGVIPSNQDPGGQAEDVQLLSAAQWEAERIVGQAHDYAHRLAEYARKQYESQLQQAEEEARTQAEQATAAASPAAAAAPTGDAAQEALRVYGQLMSHMEEAAKNLHDSSEQLARTMERFNRDAVTQIRPALPRHSQ